MGGSIPEESTKYLISDLLHPLISDRIRVIVDSRGFFAQRAHEEVLQGAWTRFSVRSALHGDEGHAAAISAPWSSRPAVGLGLRGRQRA